MSPFASGTKEPVGQIMGIFDAKENRDFFKTNQFSLLFLNNPERDIFHYELPEVHKNYLTSLK